MNPNLFNYEKAYSRNIGWVTEQEQAVLRTKRIAIAGMGGVGGSHLMTLARLGIGAFHIADFDSFEQENFNRQAGARISSVDRAKVDVLAEMAIDINPELDLRQFPDGIQPGHIPEFLAGVDLYVDGLDAFVLDVRRKLFAACYDMGIPAMTAGPLGMGVALLVFMPGQMTFEEYFRLEGQPEIEQFVRWFTGVAPGRLQQDYLVVPSAVDLANRRGPSTAMSCELCAGVAGVHALKILLNRGEVLAAPYGLQFDAYRNELTKTCWQPWDSQDPLKPLGRAQGG